MSIKIANKTQIMMSLINDYYYNLKWCIHLSRSLFFISTSSMNLFLIEKE